MHRGFHVRVHRLDHHLLVTAPTQVTRRSDGFACSGDHAHFLHLELHAHLHGSGTTAGGHQGFVRVVCAKPTVFESVVSSDLSPTVSLVRIKCNMIIVSRGGIMLVIMFYTNEYCLSHVLSMLLRADLSRRFVEFAIIQWQI